MTTPLEEWMRSRDGRAATGVGESRPEPVKRPVGLECWGCGHARGLHDSDWGCCRDGCDCRRHLTREEAAVIRLRSAINDEGRNPGYHHSQIMRLRKEWPILWEAILGVIA